MRILFILIIFFPYRMYAQQDLETDTLKTTKLSRLNDVNLPQVIPPSPEMSNLFRYVEFTKDLSRGLIPISIPIYDINYGSCYILI